MNTCQFNDFIEMLKPWLNDSYIHQARLGAEGTFTLEFVDGGCKTYQIDDCSSEQLEHAIAHMQKKGVQILR